MIHDRHLKTSIHSKFIDVFGSRMHYLEAGKGDPIFLLHGVPTSSYLWRHIIPYLSSLGRCIAPDLIGFGKSAKPDISYTVFDHIKYIEKFIDTLHLKKITFILHGWGSVIGIDYAMRNPGRCKGFVFYEAFLRPVKTTDISLPLKEQLFALQNQGEFSDVGQSGISFVDRMMPQNVIRTLTEEEMRHYRQPFIEKGSDKPILQYIKELPLSGVDNEVNKLIENYSEKLTHSSLPKLLLYSVPGFITTIATVMWAKDHLSNIEIIDIGEELHLAQESNPKIIGETISVWLQAVEQTKL